jgi:hypothetical protein
MARWAMRLIRARISDDLSQADVGDDRVVVTGAQTGADPHATSDINRGPYFIAIAANHRAGVVTVLAIVGSAYKLRSPNQSRCCRQR